MEDRSAKVRFFEAWSVKVKLHGGLAVNNHLESGKCEKFRRTSSLAAEREINSVNHHTTVPIGRVINSAVPARVPARRKGHTRSACIQPTPLMSQAC